MQCVMAASNITFFKDWAFVLTGRAREGQVWFRLIKQVFALVQKGQ